MYIRTIAAIVAAGGVAIAAAQQPPTSTPFGQKSRINDTPTPGRLGGVRRQPLPRLSVDTTGLNRAVPESWRVDPATGAEYRPGEVLVRFKSGVNASLRTQAMQAGRGRRIARSLPGNWTLVELEPGTTVTDSIGALRRRPEVADATLNFRVGTNQVRPNDEFHDLQWNFDAINLPAAWQINPGARNDVVVAVVDTGLNIVTDTFVFSSPLVGEIPVRFAAVPDLVTDARIVNAYDFVYQDEYPLDLGGHGTHVAGTIAQQTNNSIGVAGIAYNVKLMPLKVISGGSFISWDDIFAPGNAAGTAAVVAAAIQHAADNGAHVINLSLGTTGPVPAVQAAIEYAVSRGAFVAIAAGNDGDDGNPQVYPAAYAPQINGAMTVGAVNRNLRHAPYSSFHPYVEICAPGGETATDFDFEGGVTQVGYEEEATLTFLTAHAETAGAVAGIPSGVRSLRASSLPGNFDGRTARLGSGGAALLAGDPQPRRDRGGDKTLRASDQRQRR